MRSSCTSSASPANQRRAVSTAPDAKSCAAVATTYAGRPPHASRRISSWCSLPGWNSSPPTSASGPYIYDSLRSFGKRSARTASPYTLSALMMDPEKYASATVMSRRDPAPDLWIIRIRTDIELPYRPGQYVTLGLRSNGRVIERPYSICSSPLEDEIELFIERVPEGELSDPLFALGVGGEVIVRRRTKGLFLREAPLLEEPHLFVATVTGIAPFVSILRTLAARARSGDWTPVPIITLQGAARSAELGYADELVALADEFSWFTYVPT